jgi:hypothetical protein
MVDGKRALAVWGGTAASAPPEQAIKNARRKAKLAGAYRRLWSARHVLPRAWKLLLAPLSRAIRRILPRALVDRVRGGCRSVAEKRSRVMEEESRLSRGAASKGFD